MIAYIPVTPSEFAIVDLEDLSALLAYTWCKTGGKSGYAHTRIPNSGSPGKHLLMHRMLCSGVLIDHINCDGLDNRKANLRPSNKQLNSLNSPKQRGVYKCRKKWRAQITINDKATHIGVFDTREEAVTARNSYQKSLEENLYVQNFGCPV